MSAPEQRRAANRMNSLKSTGPASPEGKAVASRNSIRHGVLSEKLLLKDEAGDDLEALMAGLVQSLNPVGVLEASIVERIAITLWRQRRLVHAEAARLSLGREPKQLAEEVSSEIGRRYDQEVQPEALAPFDEERAAWCRAVISEVEQLEEVDLISLEHHAPITFGQLQSDADEVESLQVYLASLTGGLAGYLAELLQWCRGTLKEADERPHVLELARQVAAARLVLPAESLELMARYQSALENQLYKALRALRDAQEWRLKTVEGAAGTADVQGLPSTA